MLDHGRQRERDEPHTKRRASHAAACESGDAEMDDVSSGDDNGEDTIKVDGGGEGGHSQSSDALKQQKKSSVESTRREASLAQSHSRPHTPSQMGLKDDSMAKIKKEAEKRDQRKWFSGSGEGDHTTRLSRMNIGKKRNDTHYCRYVS